jgi:murein DD-endopeptidase MepM/ murein hydrolase activator NlpD
MPRYCAIPPVNQNRTEIGRGFGVGWNRSRTRMDQLHAGFDFKAGGGTPILAPLDGVVAWKATDAQPRGTSGFGNMIALRHDVAIPGLPNPFWTSYNHMRAPSALEVGQTVRKGDLIGYVGNTTNGQFAGMGPHLHFEVRRRNYPSSYDRDTIDPAVLWRGLGYEWTGNRQEAERLVGGVLMPVPSGPSDCPTTLSGLGQFTCLGQVCSCPCHRGMMPGACPYCRARGLADGAAIVQGEKFATAAEKDAYYARFGPSTMGQNVEPPDYSSIDPNAPPVPGSTSGEASGGGGGMAAVVGVALLGALLLLRR